TPLRAQWGCRGPRVCASRVPSGRRARGQRRTVRRSRRRRRATCPRRPARRARLPPRSTASRGRRARVPVACCTHPRWPHRGTGARRTYATTLVRGVRLAGGQLLRETAHRNVVVPPQVRANERRQESIGPRRDEPAVLEGHAGAAVGKRLERVGALAGATGFGG